MEQIEYKVGDVLVEVINPFGEERIPDPYGEESFVISIDSVNKITIEDSCGVYTLGIGFLSRCFMHKPKNTLALKESTLGEEYNTIHRNTAKITYVGKTTVVLLSENQEYVVDFQGKGVVNQEQLILSKVDKRPWLKDMPDVGIFTDEVKWLACDGEEEWFFYEEKPTQGLTSWESYSGAVGELCGIKLPNLMGGKWEDSLISTEELEQWQSDNK